MDKKSINRILSLIFYVLIYLYIDEYIDFSDVNLNVIVIILLAGSIIKILSIIIIKKRTQKILDLFSTIVFEGLIVTFFVLYSISIGYSLGLNSQTFILLGITLLLIIELINVTIIYNRGLAILLTIPLLILSSITKTLINIIDILFPPRIQELVPYILAFRQLLISITQMFASNLRLETDATLETLDAVSNQLDEISEGYMVRKSVGQSIDFGLTFVVFVGFSVLSFLTNTLNIPTWVIAALFTSLSLALSTFAGLFGPFYGFAGACKEFNLKHGNYRGASFYKIFEQLFSIPFKVASAGFLLLDLPPVDADSLNDFKQEMEVQLTEISDNFNSLLGKNKSAVPRKTRKLIERLVQDTEQSLSKLDYAKIQKEINREFALTYFQHEFSWKPWQRKSAVSEFASNMGIDIETAEDALTLISFKITQGQMSEDLIQNIMISAALRGVIKLENQFQELLGDLELSEICTGLMLGARQFLADHYASQSKIKKIFKTSFNFILGIFTVPIVMIILIHKYTNRIFDETVVSLTNAIFNKRVFEYAKYRLQELFTELSNLPINVGNSIDKYRKKDKSGFNPRKWNLMSKFKKVIKMIWTVLLFPILILLSIFKWIVSRFKPKEEQNAKDLFDKALSQAALVAMYDELFKQLVQQQNLSF